MIYYEVEALTGDGWTPIKDYNIGDMFWQYDSSERLTFEQAQQRAMKLSQKLPFDLRIAERKV